MAKLSERITLDRAEYLTCDSREIVTKLENWVKERFDESKFYALFRWEVNCRFMDACAIDNEGRVVFIIKID